MMKKEGEEDKEGRGRREPNILEFKSIPEYNGNKKFTRTRQRILTSKKRINKLKDRLIEIIQAVEQQEIKLKNNERSLGDLWDYIQTYKHNHSESPRRGEKSTERTFDDIMAENFPNLLENVDLHV